MNRSRRIAPPSRAMALLGLVLWGQLVFGAAMTMWRYSLIRFSGWQVYPSGVPAEYDEFIQLAVQTLPNTGNVIYLSPTGDRYTARFARLNYFLYPRELIWLGLGPRDSALSRWIPASLDGTELRRAVTSNRVCAVLIDDITDPVPLQGKRIIWHPSTYILILGQ